jgi:ribonuclease Z
MTCFGTGDGWPCEERNHAAFLYRLGKTSILIDCGEAIDGQYKASGLSYDLFDAIFISHLHSDHFGGFFMLMQGCWLEGRRKPLPVYLPKGAIKPLRAMLDAAFLFDEALKFRLQLRPISSGKPFSVGNARVTAFPTSHLAHTRARFGHKYASDFSAFCFLIEAGGRRIGHTADLGKPEDLVPLLEKPLDLLTCELAHFSPTEIFAYLRGRKIQRVEFMHIGRPFYENLPRTRRLAARMLPDIAHGFPRDLDQISF